MRAIPSISTPFSEGIPPGFLPFEEFVQKFSLGTTTTERLNEKTKMLSQTMQSDVVKGIELLFEADQAVVGGLETFLPAIKSLAPQLASRMQEGGRIFLVGSGSSGRIAVDLAAKCNQNFPSGRERIRGVISGGDSALIRAKEGFEDSEEDGARSLASFHLRAEDTVILISASGSASFNVGCGHFAANEGAQVYYFYNSEELPSRTRQLFSRENNPVRPLELDIGPQAISGSTRLQGASLAELCLGALLGSVCFYTEGNEADGGKYAEEILEKMREGSLLVAQQLETIGQFAKKESTVLLSPGANFRRIRDETDQGYVTLIGGRDAIREILVDTTEASPTFSVNPIRREGETEQKRGEFRAYLVGEPDNRAAWELLLGRKSEAEALREMGEFLLGLEVEGNHSYDRQPTGPGNFVVGVAKRGDPTRILPILNEVQSRGGDAGMILLSNEKSPHSYPVLTLTLEKVPSDRLGLVESLLLKQVLNLISNGTMILSGKVHGNRMVDVRASNRKLIDRSLRLIKEIWEESGRPMPLSDSELYRHIAYVSALKKTFEDSGTYTPSLVKIILALIYLRREAKLFQFEEALDFLARQQERLDFLNPYTVCIDGGGSKTLLQVIDGEGNIVPLVQRGKSLQSIESGASNINVVKKEGVRESLHGLFEGVKIGASQRDLREILPTSRVIAGFAGVSIPENRASLSSLFEELGISNEKLQLYTDAELALKLLEGNGLILIAGTGSICFAEKGGVRQRVGGLGRILGDEGSGYQMGLEALRAGLAEEFGYGPPTQLTPALRSFFGVAELKTLSPKINSLEITSSSIASAAPLVFEMAASGDPAAAAIISRAAEGLRQLVATALTISQLADCELHLWGGVFKGSHAESLIEKIEEAAAANRIHVVNRSLENAAVLFARQTEGKGLREK